MNYIDIIATTNEQSDANEGFSISCDKNSLTASYSESADKPQWNVL